MARNIVICCDGTNNQFGSNNTNVVRLFQVLNRNPKEQIVYYDPGLGTLPEVGALTKTAKWISKVWGLAFGSGISRKIEEAYIFLMNWHEPGDRIFLLGFSRGAYTARALAGVLFQFGLLPAGMDNLVPYVLRLSRKVNELDGDSDEAKANYWKVTQGFHETFARLDPTLAQREQVKIRFLGLWDTVSSVGWAWEPKHFAYTANNPNVEVVRHAISIDERRWFFRQNTWHAAKDTSQDVVERWFPGDHCDVGGGHNANDNRLSYEPFFWMVDQAQRSQLLVDDAKCDQIRSEAGPGDFWAQTKHDLLSGWWQLAQFIPKLSPIDSMPKWGMRWKCCFPFLTPKPRSIREGSMLHKAALLRIRQPNLNYRPPNLDADFLEMVRSLPEVPESMRYTSGGSTSKPGAAGETTNKSI